MSPAKKTPARRWQISPTQKMLSLFQARLPSRAPAARGGDKPSLAPARPRPARPREMRRRKTVRRSKAAPAESALRSEDRDRLGRLAANMLGLDRRQLTLQWRNHLGGSAPASVPTWLLARLLAYRIQATAFGGLSEGTRRQLRALQNGVDGSGLSPFAARQPEMRDGAALRPGALLTREWRGRLERVTVLSEGFTWNGETYASLSMVAKAITGTSWNGHRFFGLRSGRRPLKTPRPRRTAGTDAARADVAS